MMRVTEDDYLTHRGRIISVLTCHIGRVIGILTWHSGRMFTVIASSCVTDDYFQIWEQRTSTMRAVMLTVPASQYLVSFIQALFPASVSWWCA